MAIRNLWKPLTILWLALALVIAAWWLRSLHVEDRITIHWHYGGMLIADEGVLSLELWHSKVLPFRQFSVEHIDQGDSEMHLANWLPAFSRLDHPAIYSSLIVSVPFWLLLLIPLSVLALRIRAALRPS